MCHRKAELSVFDFPFFFSYIRTMEWRQVKHICYGNPFTLEKVLRARMVSNSGPQDQQVYAEAVSFRAAISYFELVASMKLGMRSVAEKHGKYFTTRVSVRHLGSYPGRTERNECI